ASASSLFDLFCMQAEDDIRDFHVTGVQTCALPISVLFDCFNPLNRPLTETHMSLKPAKSSESHSPKPSIPQAGRARGVDSVPLRSEERRVGRECGSGCAESLIGRVCVACSYYG